MKKLENPVIISGEASETDSEDFASNENETSPSKLTTSTSYIQGAIVEGEDSESQDEHEGNDNTISKTSSSESCNSRKHLTNKSDNDNSDSLLHRKLRECNYNFHQNMETLYNNVINNSTKHLLLTDQHLLKSQVVLQNAVTSLKVLNGNSKVLKDKLDSVISMKFLSNVNSL